MTSSRGANRASVSSTTISSKPTRFRRAGARGGEPARPGWHAWPSDGVVNPKAPAVPATLHLRIEEYFAACALIGVLGSQAGEPQKEWVADWACEMGEIMAKRAKRRWART